jgi:type I restriction enzyme S subunit
MTHKNKLPKDWKWVKLGDLTQKINKVKRKEVSEEEELIYLDIGGIDNSLNKIVTHKNYLWKDAPSRAQQIVEVGDILFSTVRTYMKNIAIVDKKIYQHQIASSGFTVLRANKETIYKYIFYLSISDVFLNPLNELQTGSSYPAVRDTDVLNQKVPLPSLETQNLIVFKIEELFSELDKGIEDLKTAQQQLKIYRQSVLKWAFEGKLTNKKVKEGELPKEWKMMKIGEIGKVKGGKRLPKGHNYSEESTNYVYLRVTDFENQSINLKKLKYLFKETQLAIKNYTISKEDVFISIAGTIGEVGTIPEKLDGSNLTENAAKITELKDVDNKYLSRYLSGSIAQAQIKEKTKTTTQPKLSLYRIEEITVPLPSLEEQHLIVQEIESRLSVADKMEESITQSLQQAEALRQSILKKAFEGKLV